MSELALTTKRCKPCEGVTEPLTMTEAQLSLKQLEGWQLDDNGKIINRIYRFKNYYETIAFVNAVAWISHQENHHPNLEVSYNYCLVSYTTHAINGLSENDFICASKVNALR
ncbi:MAG: 4a-hydroxytetrahydrobiopterin dehydratase [Beggiatoa sp. IS2]|nr:MAG: 4a-hydroxytetrahydrobiopterin dehydratase [Beggiatoa sp. IS2]